jgi:signal transduction histidine kinase
MHQVTPDLYDRLGVTLQSVIGYWRPVLFLAGMAVLAVPWLVGLVLRVSARARVEADLAAADVARAAADVARAAADREQARQLAQVREDQTRLARDVHDVVGHSLAAVLAQAESGQYLPDDDPAALKRTLATIATSARTSLQNVRQVLSATQEAGTASTPGLDSLVEGLRTSGHEVVATQLGTPRPLPPELEVTAFRVLQEMTTNAMRHGRRDRPVTVRRHWPDGTDEAALTITVENVAKHPPLPPEPQTPTGQGLVGMRERLEAVGGRLDVCQRDVAGERTFTVTAWLPVATRP